MNENNDQKKEIFDIIDETVELSQKVVEIKKEEAINKVREARKAEYTYKTLNDIAPMYKSLYNDSSISTDFQETTISGELSWNEMKKNYKSFLSGQSAESNIATIASTATTLTVFGSMLPTALNESKYPSRTFKPSFFFEKTDHNGTEQRLRNFDINLGNTYHSVWEILGGITADRERAALYQMRQTYDHFFHILVPNNEVRMSSFWKRKSGDKPNLVTRREALHFAANKYIKDKEVVDLLVSSIDHILNSYDDLHRAHKRGEIGIQKAQLAINEMDRLIVEWLDAIEELWSRLKMSSELDEN